MTHRSSLLYRFSRNAMRVLSLAVSMVLIPHAHAAIFGGNFDLAAGLAFVGQSLTGAGIPTSGSLPGMVIRILEIVLNYVTLIAVITIIIAGIYLIVSNGDEGQKDKAKNIIIYTVIGLVVVILSRVIVVFVNSLI